MKRLQLLEEQLEEERREAESNDITQLTTYAPYDKIKRDREALKLSIARRKRFLEDGGQWLFALYDDGKHQFLTAGGKTRTLKTK